MVNTPDAYVALPLNVGAPMSLAVQGDGTVWAVATALRAHTISAANSGARNAAAETNFFISRILTDSSQWIFRSSKPPAGTGRQEVINNDKKARQQGRRTAAYRVNEMLSLCVWPFAPTAVTVAR